MEDECSVLFSTLVTSAFCGQNENDNNKSLRVKINSADLDVVEPIKKTV